MAGGITRKRGRKRGSANNVVGGRAFMREIADDPALRVAFKSAVASELAKGNADPYIRAFQHGYGNPPSALDVTVSGPGSGPIEYRAVYGDMPTGRNALPAAAIPVSGEGTE